jgi:hypothetical protein
VADVRRGSGSVITYRQSSRLVLPGLSLPLFSYTHSLSFFSLAYQFLHSIHSFFYQASFDTKQTAENVPDLTVTVCSPDLLGSERSVIDLAIERILGI